MPPDAPVFAAPTCLPGCNSSHAALLRHGEREERPFYDRDTLVAHPCPSSCAAANISISVSRGCASAPDLACAVSLELLGGWQASLQLNGSVSLTSEAAATIQLPELRHGLSLDALAPFAPPAAASTISRVSVRGAGCAVELFEGLSFAGASATYGQGTHILPMWAVDAPVAFRAARLVPPSSQRPSWGVAR